MKPPEKSPTSPKGEPQFDDEVEPIGDRSAVDASGVLGGESEAHGEHSGEETTAEETAANVPDSAPAPGSKGSTKFTDDADPAGDRQSFSPESAPKGEHSGQK